MMARRPDRNAELAQLIQGEQTDEVRALEDRIATRALGSIDARFDVLTRRSITAWVAAFGSVQAEASNPGVLRRILAAIRAAIRRLLGPLGTRAEEALSGALLEAVRLGARQHAAFLDEATGRDRRPIDGRPSRRLRARAAAVTAAVADRRDRALAMLRPGRVRRWSDAQTGIAVARSATSAVRTEITTVVNEAVNEATQAAIDHVGEKKLWIAERDACVNCAAYAGLTVAADAQFPAGLSWDPNQRGRVPALDGPPLHPNCFPAGTVASGPGVRAATNRWYEGEMVEVRTRGGRVLTVTPNHPILTAEGWVAAGLLDEGSQVVGDLGLQRVLAGNPDDHQRPTLIENVAGALRSTSSVTTVSVPVAPEDFHGDGIDGEVNVVRSNGLLSSGLQSPQPFREEQFGGAGADLLAFTGRSNSRTMLGRLLPAAYSSVGSFSVGAPLLRGPAVHKQTVGGGNAARLYTCFPQKTLHGGSRYASTVRDALDALAALEAFDDPRDRLDLLSAHLDATSIEEVVHRIATHPEGASDGTQAFTAAIELDDVIGVKRFPWSGHVFNLETTGGWYIANGILVHNCRCRVVAWNDSWAQEGVISMPDAVRREARRSVARGWSLPTESGASRIRAARELLRTGAGLPKTVEEFARLAVAAGRFQDRTVPTVP